MITSGSFINPVLLITQLLARQTHLRKFSSLLSRVRAGAALFAARSAILSLSFSLMTTLEIGRRHNWCWGFN
jgi:hypothetical protein